MKRFLLALIILASCSEKEEVTPSVDPFVGSWELDNADINLKISFDVDQDKEGLTFHNVIVEYPEITEALTYEVETYGRFAVNAGYQEIRIIGGGDTQWVIITMLHNRVHLETRNKLDVYQMTIEMVNRNPVELQDQVFQKL